MTKRIFRGIFLTALSAMILAALLITLSVYYVYEMRMTEELRSEAAYILHGLSRAESELAYFEGFASPNRVTLVAADGTVLYDSSKKASGLDNHYHRPEVNEALKTGSGESRRYSSTLAETTFYYAVMTPDGNVLRLSNTRSSVLGIFLRIAPLLLLIMSGVAVVSLVIARLVSWRIVTPINTLNLDAPLENDVYDELSPLLLRLDRQKKQIAMQMKALAEKQHELSAVTENMREGLILLDANSHVISMNASAGRIFGVEAGRMAGSSILALVRDALVKEAIESAHRGSSADAVFERNGRHYQVLASPVAQNGSATDVVLLMLDITDRYTAEMSRREFTANVSHELKTPLTSISGYAEIMRDGLARPEDMKAFAARICDEANRLIALVNDILELSRLDEHKGLGEKTEVDLLQMAQSVARHFMPRAEEKGIILSVDGMDLSVYGYPALLNEMIANLVDNAVKYTDRGGAVRISVAQRDNSIVLSVCDTGIGIPEEHQPHVFERFYRVDKSHSKATGGTGLGLSIVKHIAAVHDADIRLESEVGKGTCVRILFKRLHQL
ncbi:MAG TPA: ATP-binding protein [Thermoclostridium caenicola]|nr:ATP-binding protein [Thermoclostridium caenicola]